jgi:hypothetical protein
VYQYAKAMLSVCIFGAPQGVYVEGFTMIDRKKAATKRWALTFEHSIPREVVLGAIKAAIGLSR